MWSGCVLNLCKRVVSFPLRAMVLRPHPGCSQCTSATDGSLCVRAWRGLRGTATRAFGAWWGGVSVGTEARKKEAGGSGLPGMGSWGGLGWGGALITPEFPRLVLRGSHRTSTSLPLPAAVFEAYTETLTRLAGLFLRVSTCRWTIQMVSTTHSQGSGFGAALGEGEGSRSPIPRTEEGPGASSRLRPALRATGGPVLAMTSSSSGGGRVNTAQGGILQHPAGRPTGSVTPSTDI